MNEQEFAELAAGRALGALGADDEQAFQRALREHPEWAARAEADAATAAAMAERIAPVEPDAHLRASLMASIQTTPQDPTPTDAGLGEAVAPAPRRRWARGWFALAASLALILGIGGIVAVVSQQAAPPAVAALERIEAAPDAEDASATVAGGGEATLHWSVSIGEAVLVSDGLPTLAEDQVFELWYVRDGAPISAGTFEPARATTTALLDPGMEPGDTIAVTVEQEGGSPTGQPTSEPIVTIPTA